MAKVGETDDGLDVAESDDFSIAFWGVRGSIACPGDEYQRYGGNTSCIEVRCGGRLLILDAGTGLRPLGVKLKAEAPLDANILLTHTHLDHIAGVPFFGPFFDKRNRFRLWAGHLTPERNLHDVLCQYMAAPLFPVPPQIFAANLEFRDFKAGEDLDIEAGVTVRTAPLNHPNRATGYRIEYGGKAFCYVTDTEHKPDEPNRTVLDLIAGADLVVYDSTYTDEEYPNYVGWGHSTWQEGLRLVRQAGAERLAIFHHDPTHDDAFMDRIAEAAEKEAPGTLVAREGMVLTL